ncbi:hypothetical protein Y032_0863g2749 [Ancylostoma ceylanicum]|uniref:Uncharacterized protein n=1 Tax=Ancylostoma ceylanicum TaxID=53326 RepID=A0A016WBP5_9BILA|nr:hypothetical protein Y032_0863g2749 [Ancylostoma ceylanicum]
MRTNTQLSLELKMTLPKCTKQPPLATWSCTITHFSAKTAQFTLEESSVNMKKRFKINAADTWKNTTCYEKPLLQNDIIF